MSKSIILMFALGLLVSCGQGTKKNGTETEQEIMPIAVSDFLSDAAPFVDKNVNISGTVVHVCRHGGQRMFIVGENGEERIRITTGEDIAEFDIELEGEKVEVKGIVRELIIDETYLAEWEAELLEGSKQERGEGHEGGVGHGEHQGDATAESSAENELQGTEAEEQLKNQLTQIQGVRDEIAASGEDHLSDYWIETLEFKVIEE
jgi:hypothetical protein